MGDSSPFVSSCSRRQWARRRGGRTRRNVLGALMPTVMAVSLIAVAMGAYLAGRGL